MDLFRHLSEQNRERSEHLTGLAHLTGKYTYIQWRWSILLKNQNINKTSNSKATKESSIHSSTPSKSSGIASLISRYWNGNIEWCLSFQGSAWKSKIIDWYAGRWKIRLIWRRIGTKRSWMERLENPRIGKLTRRIKRKT